MKFYIHKLGCPKNDVDADYIAARLIADGHQLTYDPEDADSATEAPENPGAGADTPTEEGDGK